MREFEKADYQVYPDSEDFRDGEKPLIYRLESGFDIIADGNGVYLSGYVGTKDIWYELFKSRTHIKASVTCAAREWIEELEPLQKHEQAILLNAIGLQTP